MYFEENGIIYSKRNLITLTQTAQIIEHVGSKYKAEEILDGEGSIAETKHYKFNLELGEYEEIEK